MKRAISLTSIFLLAACTVGPNYSPPTISTPTKFAAPQALPIPGANIDPAHWWSAFKDPQLDSLVSRALAGNPDIAIAASRIRQARIQEIIARARNKPTLNADANVNHIEFSKNAGLSSLARAFGGGSSGTTGGGATGGGATGGSGTGSGSSGIALPGSGITTFALGFDSSWELDLFGGARRGREAAVARTDAAIWSRRDAGVTLAAEVAQAYFALRLDQAQIATIEAELDRQRRSLQIAGNRSSVGLTPQIDVTRQRSQITSAEARLEPIRADVSVRIHAIGILLGKPPAALLGELTKPYGSALPVPAVPAGLPSDLLRRRPDIREAERNLAASTADIGVAVADLYPKFTLTGMAQLLSSALGNLFSRDSVQLTGNAAAVFPLIDWGRRKATVGLREEDREQAYISYQAAVLGALRDVEDALVRIDAERRRNAALGRAVADAESSAHAAEAQYRTGFVAQDTLLSAQTDVLTAREQLVGSTAQLRQLTAALFKALGGGWQSLPDFQNERPQADSNAAG